jgi:hypothetical protein
MVAAGPVMMFVIERRLSWGISRRLQRGRTSITIRTRYTGGAWNPARPRGPGNSTPSEPGWATYTLTDDGLVQLDLVRADGRREQFVGPPVEPPAGYRRMRRAGAIPTLVYLSCAGIGFALGFGLTDSHNVGSRVEAGILAAVGGWVIAGLGLTLASAVWRVRAQRAQDAAPDREPER